MNKTKNNIYFDFENQDDNLDMQHFVHRLKILLF